MSSAHAKVIFTHLNVSRKENSMKKFLTLLLVVVLLALVGCNSAPQNEQITDASTQEQDTATNQLATDDTAKDTGKTNEEEIEPPPRYYISLRSEEQLSKMREMALCTDEKEIKSYLTSIGSEGATNKEDLVNFLDLLERFPYFNIVDGDISWMAYFKGKSEDTGKDYEVFHISLKAENGDWIRFEYLLSEKDPSDNILNQINNSTTQFTSKPLKSSDERLTIFSETRKDHPTDPGEIVRWISKVDGIYAFIVCYTSIPNQINTDNILNEAPIFAIS